MDNLSDWLASFLRASPPETRPSTLDWPAGQRPDSFLDAVVDDWRIKLADKCRESVASATGDPEKWVDSLLMELTEPRAGWHLDDLGFAAVDRDLVGAAMASLNQHERYHVLQVDWPETGCVVLVRIVQGLPERGLQAWMPQTVQGKDRGSANCP